VESFIAQRDGVGPLYNSDKRDHSLDEPAFASTKSPDIFRTFTNPVMVPPLGTIT
jgi:hypothetical protein